MTVGQPETTVDGGRGVLCSLGSRKQERRKRVGGEKCVWVGKQPSGGGRYSGGAVREVGQPPGLMS